MHPWNCIFIYYVDKARALEDYSEVTAIGMNEISKKGHNYITVVADLSQRKVSLPARPLRQKLSCLRHSTENLASSQLLPV